MRDSTMNRRIFLSGLVAPAVAAGPAAAQIMPDNGIDFGFFRSRQEQLAREVCEKGLPECRADIRRQMQEEKGISLLTPWISLCVAVLGVLLYARKREKAKEQVRKAAQRKHVPGQFKQLRWATSARPPISTDAATPTAPQFGASITSCSSPDGPLNTAALRPL
jgi:hypothetical protein